MSHLTKSFAVLACLLGAQLLSACGDSGVPSASGPTPGSGTGDAGAAPTVLVLSNRSDLISGNDALVEVSVPEAQRGSPVQLRSGAHDFSSALVESQPGRLRALVTDLALGSNTIIASVGGRSGSATVVNHPIGGPVFSGPQAQPWTCTNPEATDAQCNQEPEYTWFYKANGSYSLAAYDMENPPSDVATTTTETGETVPFIVRMERGYMDRDEYRIAVLYQPDKPWTGAQPQAQFANKLLITHGGGCGVQYSSRASPSVTGSTLLAEGIGNPATGLDAVVEALGSGFAVLSTSLNNGEHNCNIALQAESLIMGKEYLIDHYGTLRYTIGYGCSGGSLTQQWVSNAYPGIYQGLLVTCSFPDAWSTATQALDYHVLNAYFQDPSRWGTGVVWPNTQAALVAGLVDTVNILVVDNLLFPAVIPTNACLGTTDANRYAASTNPEGVRCTIQDFAINVFGPKPPERWEASEQKIGRGFAGVPVDNVGVQYGLAALQAGLITAAQFVDVNAKVGGLDGDILLTPHRLVADDGALANAYRSGAVNSANNLNRVGIIDCMGTNPDLGHDNYRALAIRARLDKAHGTHGNHVVWQGPAPMLADTACAYNSFIAMNEWLGKVESDTSSTPYPQKLIANKPASLADACWNGSGVKLQDELCPSTIGPLGFQLGAVPVLSTPRRVAGDAITTDINKCQLKPLDRTDNYGPLGLTDAQWTQMQALFPEGVCDFSKPGVSQQPAIAWQTYQEGNGRVIYGGRALPAVPDNSGSGWASPVFDPFRSASRYEQRTARFR